MAYLGSWKIDDYLTIPLVTHRFSTGAAYDATGDPAYRVYEDETATAILTGTFAKLDDANTTGFYTEQIQLTAANGFEQNKCYTVYKSATVDSVAAVAVDTFQIAAAVNVTHLGGSTQSATDLKDFADAGYDPDTNKVQGVVLTDTCTTLTGHTAQTGDSYARIGANGAGLSAVPWNATWDAEVQSECQDAIETNNLDHLCKTAVANNDDMTTEVTDGTIISNMISHHDTSTFVPATMSLYGIQSGAATVSDIWAYATKEITAVGSGAIATTSFASGAINAAALATDAVAEIVDGVWDEDVDTSHQTSGTAGKKLDDAGAAGDPLSNQVPGSYGAGTAGKVIGDYINSSVAAVKTDTAAIKTKTDYLPSATAGQNGGLFIAGTNAATTITTGLTTTFTGNLTGSVASVTGHTPQTGDCYARLGAPAGVSVSADIASIKSDSTAILVDTGTTLDGRIPSALVGGKMDSNVGAISADSTAADNCESFFDGTGYAGTNNIIPTVTTVTTCTTCTNLTNAPTAGDLTATMKASVNTEVDNALNTAVPGTPTADSINERIKTIDDKVPSKAYLTGTANSDGDIQMSEATGDYPGSVATVTTLTNWKSIGLKKAVEYANFHFVMRDSTNHLPATGKTVSAYRTIDAGSEGSCTNTVSETANGEYKITLSSTDLNGDSIMFRFYEASCDTLFVHVKTQS